MIRTIQTPAKINLYLRITGKRPDGYHDLETVFLPVPGLVDTLQVEVRSAPGISMACADPRVPVDSSNLCWRAAAAFLEATGLASGIHLELDKRIPVAAGMGGGSSDAAATLRALSELNGAPLSMPELARLGAGLGADVPFFLNPVPSLATGIGEILTPVACARPLPIVLVNPGFPLSTRWAYQQLQKRGLPSNLPPVADILQGLASGSLAAVAEATCNVFEPVAEYKFPVIGLLLEFMAAAGCLAARLCGSGPTVFGLCPDLDVAARVAAQVQAEFGDKYWVWAGQAG